MFRREYSQGSRFNAYPDKNYKQEGDDKQAEYESTRLVFTWTGITYILGRNFPTSGLILNSGLHNHEYKHAI